MLDAFNAADGRTAVFMYIQAHGYDFPVRSSGNMALDPIDDAIQGRIQT